MHDVVRVEVVVAVSPERAFQAFTEEMDAWWRASSPYRWLTRGGTLALRDGALVETVDGEEHRVGDVLVWEPGARLAFTWAAPSFARGEVTEVHVGFLAHSRGTRVVLEHRGWAAIRNDHPVRRGTGDGAAFRGLLGLAWSQVLGVVVRRITDDV